MAASVVPNTYNPATFSSLFVFTPKNTAEGQEHEKILFFHSPIPMSVEEQTRHVGLSEALVNFTSKFSPLQPCEAVHFEKHTSSFYQPEKDFWVILRVNNPSSTKTRDGKTVTEYKENDVDDTALHTISEQCYAIFKLFHGSFRYIMDNFSEDVLKQKLQNFFPRYLDSLKFDQMDLFSTLEGIHFLPVDKNVYLRIQCFINLAENNFPKIHYSSFLYRDHLVWSGLEQDDMRPLYRYLVTYLNNSQDNNNNTPVLNITQNAVQEGFITGPENVEDGKTKFNVPSVYIGQKDELFDMVIYRLQEITTVFLIDAHTNDRNFFKQLDSFIATQYDFLAPILEDHYLKKQGFEEQYRYIYFNHMNCALKTSLKEKGAIIPKETMKMLNDIHSDFTRSPENIGEVLIRTQNDPGLWDEDQIKENFMSSSITRIRT